MGLSGKLSTPLQRYGVWGGCLHLVREGLSRYIKVQLVYRETLWVKRFATAMEIRVFTSDEDVEQPEELDEHCPDWRDRLQKDNRLVCVASEGELAGFGWGRVQNELGFTYVDSCLPLERAVFYVYDCYTLSQHRGKGVYQAVLKGLANEATKDEIYVACRWNNTGSIKGVRKAGFMLDRVFVYFRFLGKPVRFHF